MIGIDSLYYFIEAAKDLHITLTAKRLYITQQTLSNHIMRIENYYNVKLFHRQPKLQLTSAGREVLRFAEEVYKNELNLKGILSDEFPAETGEITIGASSPRSNYYLPDVLTKFSARYPDVMINLVDKTSGELEKLTQDNKLDFAVTVDTSVTGHIISRSQHSDPIYFCVSDKLLRKHYGPDCEAVKRRAITNGADLREFSRIPFMMISPNNRMGSRINECFRTAGYAPKTYLNATYTTIMTPLCNAGLAGGFTSSMNLTRWINSIDDDVNIFPLVHNGQPVMLTLRVIYNKNRYLNHHCRYFLDILDTQFSEMEAERLSRISKSLNA